MKKNNYDVVIVGGGTSDCACAYVSAKYGLKTLLVEKSDVLGGAMTQGLVVPCMNTSDKNFNNEFYQDLIEYSKQFNAQITYSDGNSGWFNPELLKIVLDKMLKDVNVDVIFSSCISRVKVTPSKSLGELFHLHIMSNILSLCVDTNYLIDATGNGKIFEILNSDFQNKSEKQFQTPTLRFMISNVDIKCFRDWIMDLDSDRDVTTSCEVMG